MPIITEHSAKLDIALPRGDVNAKMEVFYNPLMVSNRNISLLLINTLPQKGLIVADPLAGSGIRSLRFMKELHRGKIKTLIINDIKENFSSTWEKNMRLNNISAQDQKKIQLFNEEASLFLLQNKGMDYIDIDPFGTPNPFLSAAIAAISRGGVLAVTATDTAAVTGTYPAVTKRKYWATSLKNYMMHETGLRILIRKIQLLGVQFDKALTPLLAYHKDHYFRVYFQAEKGKEKCDKIIAQHHYFLYCPHCLQFKTSPFNKEFCTCKKQFQFAGPLWAGQLFDVKLLAAMAKQNPFPEEQKLLDTLAGEAKIPLVGFHDLHHIARKTKRDPPRLELVIKKSKGIRTHFSPTGVKTFSSHLKLSRSR